MLRCETQSNRESVRPLWFFHLYVYISVGWTSQHVLLIFSRGTLLHPLVFAFPLNVTASMDTFSFHDVFSVNNSYTRFHHGREVFFLIYYKCLHLLTLRSNYLQLLLPVDWQFPLFETWNMSFKFFNVVKGKFDKDLT